MPLQHGPHERTSVALSPASVVHRHLCNISDRNLVAFVISTIHAASHDMQNSIASHDTPDIHFSFNVDKMLNKTAGKNR